VNRRPLKIAMVTEYAYPVLGGVSEHVHFLSRELAARGNEVTVVTSKAPRAARARARILDAENTVSSGYRTTRIGTSVPVFSNGSIARVSMGFGFRARLRRALTDVDVVHSQGLAPPTLPIFALRESRAPVTVGTFHTYFDGGHWAYRLFHRFVSRSLAHCDRKIAVSDACVTALAQYFPPPYDIVPNGIDCDYFSPLPDESSRRPGPPRILFVGRFDTRNGLHTLLDAAEILTRDRRDFVLQIAGDGPARPFYERQAKRNGLWDRIEWLGLVKDERPELYRQATVLAAPCTLASFGVVLLEAFASGTPVVCADNIGFRQVIRDGAPGRFVPGSDPAALATGLAEVLDDQRLRDDWALRGRQIAEERYAWPIVAERIEALYRQVLTGTAPTEVAATL
jgi:phosphatidyl-myo-inositol alpha-mannosyltransferase